MIWNVFISCSYRSDFVEDRLFTTLQGLVKHYWACFFVEGAQNSGL